uniref:Uncharacterized protein n=1 Tax=Meloidogyne javanica TaxID=6303 RepID=A0A915LGA7_MELJA
MQFHSIEAMRIMKLERDANTYSLLDVEKSHLVETISKIEKLDLQWNKHMSKLHGIKKATEEDYYRDFPSNEPSYEFMPDFLLSQQHFVTQCEFARQMVVAIGLIMEDLGRLSKNESEENADSSCPSEINKLPENCTVDLGDQNGKPLESHTPQPPMVKRDQMCRRKHHFMVCYSRVPKTRRLEPMRKSEGHCSKQAEMLETHRLLDEKTKTLQEKDKTIVRLMSELMLARKKAEDESKKAKRLKCILDESNQRMVDAYGKRILKETHVNALQKANQELIAKNGKLKREVCDCRKKCLKLDRLEPPDVYAFCRSLIDMKMLVMVLAAFVMILDGTKDALRMVIRATNKLWKCKTKDKMRQEVTLKHGRARARIKSLLRSSIYLTLFAAVVTINPCWIFVAILFTTMD